VTPRVAAAPVSFGVARATDSPDAATLVELVADAGYAGIELGPRGWLGGAPAAAELLARNGLELVAAYVPLRLPDAAAFRDDLAVLDATLALATESATGGGLPRILLADAGDDPQRRAYAARIESHREAWPGEARSALLAANVERAAERCREQGFEVAFHHHAGTWVETPRELARLLEAIDVGLVGLCFDTGHALVGGGEPRRLLADYAELVTHLHAKDVDRARLDALRDEAATFTQMVEAGVFCDLGAGAADLAGCLDDLAAVGYDGWIVCEQDRRPGSPLEAALESARADRAFLRERGL
jgi:inosose dehydratase